MSSEQPAGARVTRSHVATGAFLKRPRRQQETILEKLPPIDPKSLKSYDGKGFGVTAGDGSLYGALATDSYAAGGLTGVAKTAVAGEFVHVPGYAGHQPAGWCHRGRTEWNDKTTVQSKENSYVSGWGRPAMPSGTNFEYNPKLKETVPRVNDKGLVKTALEDRVEDTARSQVRITGDTAYAGLSPKKARTLTREAELNLSRTASPLKSTIGGTGGTNLSETRAAFSLSAGRSVGVASTLASHPPGYQAPRAQVRDCAIFQGTFPAPRQVPGYSGHVPGGVRIAQPYQ